VKSQSPLLIVSCIGMPLCLTLFMGCSDNEEIVSAPVDSNRSMGEPGGSGGRRAEPVAANATAPQIYQQKCQGCHGDKGQGAMGPELTNLIARPDSELHQTIRDGHEKMPSFANQMTKAQINAIVAHIKKLKAQS
jgi:mono/diheme cytochrome c family protein